MISKLNSYANKLLIEGESCNVQCCIAKKCQRGKKNSRINDN